MIQRMIRAARLDVNVYEEVEAYAGATTLAMAVVVLVAVATGVGSIAGGPLVLVVGIFGGLWR